MVIIIILILSALISYPLGYYLNQLLSYGNVEGENPKSKFLLKRIFGDQIIESQSWQKYAKSLLIFNLFMFALVTIILSLQHILPFNPDGKEALEWSLVFNTAVSFTTNTNLQHYSGEVSLSYFSQIFGLMWLQFLSAATGISALAAISRGLTGQKSIGNFYQDLIKTTFCFLLPIAILFAIILAGFGVVMTYEGSANVVTLEGLPQKIARGPVAAFVAIKQLGTNGGGFFGTNSAHPFENPNVYSNIIESIAILLIPMACVWFYGFITKRMKHATIIFFVMLLLLVTKIGFSTYFESEPNSSFATIGVEQTSNLEGKELRFGIGTSALWSVLTTSTSNGSVNSMHDSLNPLAGLIPMIAMWFNVTFGGVGVGFINMILYIIIGIFISGMMVGRTPEYFGKKIEAEEMKWALLAILLHPFLILGGTALFCAFPWGKESLNNPGFHGFSEILYEFSSAAANNGSGFEGLADNTVPWNLSTGFVMLIGRYLPILFPLVIAGKMQFKKVAMENSGTLKVDTILFGFILLGSIVFIGALLFMPVAVLGPVAEHLSIQSK
ncbi:potassium-transporting ATPase subunit KdpA [Leptospira sp. 96542]|nr:potassium-transporting ATPase subunit KdpA [Leptospira sp. 96542]